MLIIARTTSVQTVVMNGNSNTWVIWQCLGRNGKTERSWVVVWKPRVTAQMRREEAGRINKKTAGKGKFWDDRQSNELMNANRKCRSEVRRPAQWLAPDRLQVCRSASRTGFRGCARRWTWGGRSRRRSRAAGIGTSWGRCRSPGWRAPPWSRTACRRSPWGCPVRRWSSLRKSLVCPPACNSTQRFIQSLETFLFGQCESPI